MNCSEKGKRVVIIQSNYIPWKGYFDMLANADAVILLDSVQSTKNDWRNRNIIKTPAGKQWLTIPIRHSNTLRIKEVEVAHPSWAKKHFRTLQQAYSRSPYACEMLPMIESWFDAAVREKMLSHVNRVFIRSICEILSITPDFVEVETLMTDAEHDSHDPSARLVELCRRIGASHYITGPAARDYLNTTLFNDAAIGVDWFDYHGFAEYPQLHGPFDHHVSILDLLLMTGAAGARRFALRSPHDQQPRDRPHA